MPELLAELVAKITADATELKKALAESDKDMAKFGDKTEKESKSISQSFQQIGKTFTLVGAAITASMTGIVLSFTKTGSELNDLSLKTGVSVKALAGLKYAAEQNGASLGTVEMAIKRTAAAMQQVKDGSAESTRAFDRMGLSLKDLEGLNPEDQFMKIASAIAEIPDPMTRAATAQDLFGRSGMDMLPMLSQGAAGLRKMMEEGVKYSGWTGEGAKLADAFGDSVGTLTTAMGGLFNTLASNLVPILQRFITSITEIISNISAWAKEHPELVKWVGLLGASLGVVLTTAGLLILGIPKLIAAFNAIKIAAIATSAAIGPVGWAIAIISIAIMAALPWIMKNTDALDKMTGSLKENEKAKAFIIRTGEKLEDVLAREAALTKRSTEDYGKITQSLKTLRDSYGDLGNAIKSKADMARYASEQVSNALDRELDKARESYQTQMGFLSNLYAEKIRLLNAGATAAIKKIQEQIEAIDKQTETEDRSLQDTRDAERKTEIQRAMATAQSKKDDKEYSRLKKELADFIADIARRHLLDKRQDEKDALRDSIENIRTNTQAQEQALNAELDKAQQVEKDKLSATETRIAQSKIALNNELSQKLIWLATELEAAEDMEIAKLGATKNRIAEEIKAEREAAKTKWDIRADYMEDLNRSLYWTLNPLGGGTSYGGNTGGDVVAPIPPGTIDFSPIASGGIVTQPTMSLIGEAGPEAVIPLNEAGGLGGITINFTQPVFFEREDTLYKFADIVAKAIDRKDRLRFGSPYHG